MGIKDVQVVEDLCSMFEFTKEEFESISKKAMLNDELKTIFEMKIKGYSNTEIYMKLNLSEASFYRRLKKLKKKIMKVI